MNTYNKKITNLIEELKNSQNDNEISDASNKILDLQGEYRAFVADNTILPDNLKKVMIENINNLKTLL